jgi:5-methylphenazine-1-carboxylate 1-monooxygenase
MTSLPEAGVPQRQRSASRGPAVLVVGAGIGGLTTALELHQAGLSCRVVESVSRFAPAGVGINILPHASRQLGELGLEGKLSQRAVLTRESVFYNRFGQLIYAEPAGRAAGYPDPQYSIHRADLHEVLLGAVTERLGAGAVVTGHRVTRVDQDDRRAVARVERADGTVTDLEADVVVAADGIHSAVRAQLFPDEGPPRYSGVTMWRGVSVWPPVLTGASMIRAGWLATGKLVVYPIRNHADGQGRQLVNWVAELETPQRVDRDWTQPGDLKDFLPCFADWRFGWLDVPALLRASTVLLEYPMVDAEPLPRWSHGRVTLLGDAAHPMVPRGSNGAGQAILDARAVAGALAASPADPVAALAAYDDRRREATAAVVLANRQNPPDAILREVYERTGDRPFERLEDYVTVEELARITENYKRVAGFTLRELQKEQ